MLRGTWTHADIADKFRSMIDLYKTYPGDFSVNIAYWTEQAIMHEKAV